MLETVRVILSWYPGKDRACDPSTLLPYVWKVTTGGRKKPSTDVVPADDVAQNKTSPVGPSAVISQG